MEKVTPSSLLARIKSQPAAVLKMAFSNVPLELLANPETMVADLAMGGGHYLAAVLQLRLDAGVPRDIALKTLYGFESMTPHINHASWKLNLQGANLTKLSEVDLEKLDMKFDVIIGNPPYQAPKSATKKGLGGDNALFVKFIERALDLVAPGGYISMITPPSAFIKTTVNGKPTPTLAKLMKRGALLNLDLNAGSYFKVSTFISQWSFREGAVQGDVQLTKGKDSELINLRDLYFCPPEFEWVEFNLFKKIMNNREGTPMNVTRSKPGRDYHMKRLGYPKIEKGGTSTLGFDAEHAPFLTSQLGLWLLDYIRRHDQFIYHNLLTGIYVPADSFKLTKEEQAFIASKHWPNFAVNN
jgi:hypothetical protein